MSYTFNKKLIEQVKAGTHYVDNRNKKPKLFKELFKIIAPKSHLDGSLNYYWADICGFAVFSNEAPTDKTPIPLSDFVQPEQSERDVMAGLDEKIAKLEKMCAFEMLDFICSPIMSQRLAKLLNGEFKETPNDNSKLVAEPELADAEIVKPVLGIAPEWLWREQRVMSIKSAMERYTQSNTAIPKEWADELAKHFEFLENREQQPEPKWTPKVGEWFYITKHTMWLCEEVKDCFLGNDQNGNKEWFVPSLTFTKPTDKEVEDYMVGLAKEKFPVGTKFKDFETGKIMTVGNGKFSFYYKSRLHCSRLEKEWYLGSGKFVEGEPSNPEIWKLGTWAEIVNPVRWRAEKGGQYFWLDGSLSTNTEREINDEIDNERYRIGNYFQTTQQAEEMSVLMQFTFNNPELVKQLMNIKE